MVNRPLRIAFHALDLANTFNELLLQGVSDGCIEAGVELLTLNGGQLESTQPFEAARNYLYDLPSSRHYDGLLLADVFSFLNVSEQETALRSHGQKPVVLINQRSAAVPHVVVDNTSGFRFLVEHLIQAGAVRFAAVTGPTTNHDTAERMACLRSVLAASGLELPPERVVPKTFAFHEGEEAVRELLDVRQVEFDALVCFNDNMAFSALSELARRQIDVPGDVMVTGFDCIQESRSSSPPLTTVTFPMYELGKRSVHLLVDWLDGRAPPLETVIESTFVERKSTRPRGTSKPMLTRRPPVPADSVDLWTAQYFAAAQMPVDPVQEPHVRRVIKRLLDAANGRTSDAELFDDLQDAVHRGLDPAPFLLTATECARTLEDGKAWNERIGSLVVGLCDQSFINRSVFQRQRLLRALNLGEALLTDLDLVRDASFLAREMQELGFPLFAVVSFCGTGSQVSHRATSRLVFGHGLPASMLAGTEFSTSELLPGGLAAVRGLLIIDALHIREQALGYLVYPVIRHSGLLFKALRHQFSAALNTATLLGEVKALNHDLEVRIEERTRDWKAELVQRSQTEQELLKQRNLDSLGVLAAGLAHDFNNILSGIMGNVSLLETDETVKPETSVVLADIMKAAERARQITLQLVTFSRGGSPLLRPTSLPQLVRETTDFILRGSAVKVEYEVSGVMHEVAVDSIQISQVMGNLVLNAVQALANQTNPEPMIHVALKPTAGPEGLRAQIEVRDNGPGMEADHVANLFTPWYTTKASGTGLGLATCRSILERHGGGIEVESAPGRGTTMRLWVPLKEDTPPVLKPPSVPREALHVLVIDHDPSVLRVLESMLKRLGHRSVGVSRGEQALNVFRDAAANADPFQVLILDPLVHEGLDGKEILDTLRTEYLGLRALLSSGNSEPGFQGLLSKPYSLAELRQALDALFL